MPTKADRTKLPRVKTATRTKSFAKQLHSVNGKLAPVAPRAPPILDFSIHITSGGSVLYNTDTLIAGLQFDVDGVDVVEAAFGGAAEDADFAVEVVNREPLVLIIKSFWLDLADDGSAVGDFAEYDVLAVEVVELRPW